MITIHAQGWNERKKKNLHKYLSQRYVKVPFLFGMLHSLTFRYSTILWKGTYPWSAWSSMMMAKKKAYLYLIVLIGQFKCSWFVLQSALSSNIEQLNMDMMHDILVNYGWNIIQLKKKNHGGPNIYQYITNSFKSVMKGKSPSWNTSINCRHWRGLKMWPKKLRPWSQTWSWMMRTSCSGSKMLTNGLQQVWIALR